MINLSVQEQYAPHNACYGCGPANDSGLKLKSYILSDNSGLIAHWEPKSCYEAFPGVLSGGTIGTLLDCHCNWTAAWYLMRNNDLTHPPCTVTAEYTIKLLKPTPTEGLIELISHIIDSSENRTTVGGILKADGKVCATCEGIFVAVEEGHPAYHRW